MNKYILIAIMIAVSLLSSCQNEFEKAVELKTEQRNPIGSAVLQNHYGALEGRINIKLSKTANNNLLRSAKNPLQALSMQNRTRAMGNAFDKIDAKYIEPLFDIDPRFEERMRKKELDTWYTIYFDEKNPLPIAINELSKLTEVVYAEPIYPAKVSDTKIAPVYSIPLSYDRKNSDYPFDDPRFSEQWNFHNTGSLPSSEVGADINLIEAWKKETGKNNVIVSVVDGGIDLKHEDLIDNIYINEAELNGVAGKDDDNNGYIDDINGYNFVKKSATIFPDDASHGTHVAGVIAARNNNNIGIAGIAGGDAKKENTGVKLMSCQTFGKKIILSDKTEIIETGGSNKAIVYAANNGAVISQNSWGIPYEYRANGFSRSDRVAIDYFIEYAGCDKDGNQLPNSPMKGGVVIFAAGNDGKEFMAYPAAYDKVIAVTSMAPNWTMAEYSNHGTWADIMAPGGAALLHPRAAILSTVAESILGSKYAYMQGTSMACPHVSGVAALIVSHFGGKGFTNEDLKKKLLAALKPENIDVKNPEFKGKMGRGFLDAAAIFQTDEKKAPKNIEITKSEALYQSIKISWNTVGDEDDKTPLYYRIYVSDKEINNSNKKIAKQTTVNAIGYNEGKEISRVIENLFEDRDYYVALEAVDKWGNESNLATKKVRTKKNNNPTLTASTNETIQVSPVKDGEFTVTAFDQDGHDMTFDISGNTKGVEYSIENNIIKFKIKATKRVGIYKLVITATDAFNGSASISVPYQINSYNPPKLLSYNSNITINNKSNSEIDIKKFIKFYDVVPLKYRVSSTNPNVIDAFVDENGIIKIKAKSIGKAVISFNANDGAQGSLQGSFDIRVVNDASILVYSVYPIPARESITAIVNQEYTEYNVRIKSQAGHLIMNEKIKNDNSGKIIINTNKLNAGTYILNIEAGGKNYNKAFVKL